MVSVLRKAGVHCNTTIFSKNVQLLEYAEDIEHTKWNTTGAFSVTERNSTDIGLELNEGKIKHILSKIVAMQRIGSHSKIQ